MERALERFRPATRDWFAATFAQPTPPQVQGWDAIARGEHTLILAPTGSGKTLAAFLWCLDQLAGSPAPTDPKQRCRVLYVSPLKALAHDVERNLKAPLVGMRLAAQRRGETPPDISVALRTGDTSAADRRDIARTPPDVLITTPESLYLLLTSQAESILRSVRWLIVDEIHSVAGTKRGAHLALSIERLEHIVDGPLQRIGLSATQRPLEEIGRFLGGADRSVALVEAGARKKLDLQVIVPVEDMSNPQAGQEPVEPSGGSVLGAPARQDAEARSSIWPSVYPRLLELVRQHRSTLIFVNSRRLAERLAQRLNELAEADQPDAQPLVRAHHGSISREQRLLVEEQLKAGTLRGLVATSSLELGIDMGAIDLVVQVEAPTSVASGLQRIGRAGHTVDAVSSGKIFPKYRGDLLEAAVVVERMLSGSIEATRIPRNPLDVLAQQVVAMCAQQPWSVDELYRVVRRAYNFSNLPRSLFEGVLDMLSGRYPSDEFSQLKARLIWDRVADTIVARNDARVVAVTSGGTIPERGLYGVFLGEGGPRVGELDEEMVYESRPGETFVLGASTWRIERITPQQVIVSPAPGEPGKTPFWHGDAVGRPIELGRALGEFSRRLSSMDQQRAEASLRTDHGLDDLAARNLLAYLAEQKATTGSVPTDRTIVVERFRDELGDWRVCILTPFGGRVHAAWALAIGALVRERLGVDLYAIWTDDGIALRLPEGLEDSPIDDLLFPDAERAEDLVVRELGGSALFAARFRENAARALLLPRRRGDARTPLWQMRQRAADLMAVASRYGSFPILLETYRECLQDVFDLPALQEVLGGVQQRHIRITSVETQSASPFARSLLFDYIAEFMYEGDAPLAERRAQALALDRERLRELLGQEELRELLDPQALVDVELELQWLADRRARTPDQVHDLLRRLGDLSTQAVIDRTSASASDTRAWLDELEAARRAARVRIGGEERWLAIEDVARYRDAVGVQPPRGVPDVFLETTVDALDGLLLRYARTHAPFTSREPADRWGLPAALVHDTLRRLEERNAVLRGEFRPGGTEREWCDSDVLRSLRRRSLARLRREVEPVPAVALARFLPAWHGVGGEAGSLDRLLEVIAQLEGAFLPWSIFERDVLPARVRGYQPRLLDELCASGDVVWLARGAIGADDGRVALFRRERLNLLAPAAPEDPPTDDIHLRIREHLATRGASFFREIFSAAGGPTDAAVLDALWDLVWAGEVTNDTLSPLRMRLLRKSKAGRRPPHLSRGGPPEAAGRWSLVPPTAPSTERSHALAVALLERHGVVSRETVLGEGVPGGFAAVYPVLRAMEEAGKIRRGYFVEGLGAAQFALPGAVDRLRAERAAGESPTVHVLAAADPANPYGATLPWPKGKKAQRAGGAHVVLVDGEPALFVERSHKGLVTLPAFDQHAARAIGALRLLAENAPRRELSIERVDGEPVLNTVLRSGLEQAGFTREYLGLTLRLAPLTHPSARTA